MAEQSAHGRGHMLRETEMVRDAYFADPFTSNEDYGRMMADAADADERRGWAAEASDDDVSADERDLGEFDLAQSTAQAKSLYDLPVFGWAWREDARDLEH